MFMYGALGGSKIQQNFVWLGWKANPIPIRYIKKYPKFHKPRLPGSTASSDFLSNFKAMS